MATAASPGQGGAGADDWSRVNANKKLIVGTSADYMPYAFYSSDFKLDGFDIALARDLGRRLGVQVEFNDFAFDGLLNALKLRQVDAAIGAISVTPDREESLSFTSPYYLGQDGILAPADSPVASVRSAADMAGKKIGVQRGTSHETWLREALVTTGLSQPSNLVVLPSSEDVVRALRSKQLDLAVMDLLPAEAQAKTGGVKLVGQGANRELLAIATRQGSSLAGRLNDALAQARADGTVARLVKEYLQIDLPNQAPVPTVVVPTVSAPAATAALVPTVAPSACLDGMEYVADLNYDDLGMTAPPVLQPNQRFAKGWRLKNSGTCSWNANYSLAFARGNVPDALMGATPVRIGREVKPGETIDLQANLTAPGLPGVYQAFWQLRNAVGESFGETIWVGIQTPGAQTPAPPSGQDFRLRADARNIGAGQCTTIRWNVDNVNSVAFVDGAGTAQGVGGNDARNVCPASTTTYRLRVGLRDGQTVEQGITITVGGAAPNFRADSTQINPGQCTTLRWNIDGVRGVYFSDGGAEQGVGGNSERSVCPGGSTTYRLRVVPNSGNEIVQTVTVNVAGGAPSPNIDFRAGKTTLNRGECTNLIWKVTDAKAAYLNQGAGEALVGLQADNVNTCPEQTTNYTLRVVRNDDRSETRGLVINVNQAAAPVRPVIDSFTVDQNAIDLGQCVTLRWTTRNVPSALVLKRGSALLLENAPASGSTSDCPSKSGLTVYTLIAAGEGIGDFTVTQSANVDVRKK